MVAIASAAIAMSGLGGIATVVLFGWTTLPYLVLILMALGLRNRVRAGTVVLIGSILISAFGIVVAVGYSVSPPDALNALAFLFGPGYQLVACGIIGAVAAVTEAIRRRTPPGHCATCRYDLRGLRDSRCPECGTLISLRK